jgi:hypothetical protein
MVFRSIRHKVQALSTGVRVAEVGADGGEQLILSCSVLPTIKYDFDG